jgi:hypothetical protein
VSSLRSRRGEVSTSLLAFWRITFPEASRSLSKAGRALVAPFDPTQGELRSANELRANMLLSHDTTNHRREQCLTLSHAGRSPGRGTGQAGRIVDRKRRPQHDPAHRHRTLKAARANRQMRITCASCNRARSVPRYHNRVWSRAAEVPFAFPHAINPLVRRAAIPTP